MSEEQGTSFTLRLSFDGGTTMTPVEERLSAPWNASRDRIDVPEAIDEGEFKRFLRGSKGASIALGTLFRTGSVVYKGLRDAFEAGVDVAFEYEDPNEIIEGNVGVTSWVHGDNAKNDVVRVNWALDTNGEYTVTDKPIVP